jgi:hypothetical protein
MQGFTYRCEDQCIATKVQCNGRCVQGKVSCNGSCWAIKELAEFENECQQMKCNETCINSAADNVKYCNGNRIPFNKPCNESCLTTSEIICNGTCIDSNSSDIWLCNHKCISRKQPCNKECFHKHHVFSDGACRDINSWACDGKFIPRNKPCNRFCHDERQMELNDFCLFEDEMWDCKKNESTHLRLPKLLPCNETCSANHTYCKGTCRDPREENLWFCSDNCTSRSEICRGK